MTAKEYLGQALKLDALIGCYMRELQYWRDMAESVSGCAFQPRFDRSRPTEAPFVRCVEKIDEIERKIDVRIDELVDLKERIGAAIDKLDDREEQLVLRCRYCDGSSWPVIAHFLGTSVRTAQRIHASALENFTVPDES